MSSYLVTARIKLEKLDELEERLVNDGFKDRVTSGKALTQSLKNAKMLNDTIAVWEEEGSGDPPLQAERNAVLDEYFDVIDIKMMMRDIGWEKIRELPRLFQYL
jgi:hypothetical protein